MRTIKTNNKKIIFERPNIVSYILYVLAIVIFSFNFVNEFELNPQINCISAIIVLVFTAYTLLLTWNNWYLFIICGCIAYFNYSICIYYYLSDMNVEFYSSFINDNVMTVGINIILLFVVSLSILLECLKIPYIQFHFLKKEQKQTWVYLIIFTLLLIVWVIGYTKPLPGEERGHLRTIYEYSILLFILLYYYAGIDKKLLFASTVLILLFIGKDLYYGGRSTSIQLVVCLFLILFSHKINVKTLIPFATIGFFIFSFVGDLRADTQWSFSAIVKIIQRKLEGGFVLDTAVSAYFTSLTFVKVREFSSFYDIILYTIRFLLTILLGGRVVGAELSLITYKYYPHSFGGIFPFYFFYILGWFGPLCSSGFLILYLKNIVYKYRIKNLIKCLAVYWTSSVFRWYMYTPLSLLRGTLLFLCAYSGLILLRHIVRK